MMPAPAVVVRNTNSVTEDKAVSFFIIYKVINRMYLLGDVRFFSGQKWHLDVR